MNIKQIAEHAYRLNSAFYEEQNKTKLPVFYNLSGSQKASFIRLTQNVCDGVMFAKNPDAFYRLINDIFDSVKFHKKVLDIGLDKRPKRFKSESDNDYINRLKLIKQSSEDSNGKVC